jgi:lipoprotein-anchoring transpeptidase ErfK/SrfK
VQPLTRREFLKLAGLAGFSLAFRPLPLPENQSYPIRIARVTTTKISLRHEPSFSSERIGWFYRDELISLFEDINSPNGPDYNPLWHRVIGGYAHSGYLQPIRRHPSNPIQIFPKNGQLCQITVPFTQSYRYYRKNGWRPLYRLYYQSNHWATAIDEGPDERPWLRITDERLRIHYFIPLNHAQAIPISELTPLSPNVPTEEKRIHISLNQQILTAFEGNKPVFRTKVATGISTGKPSPNGIPTETPAGRFILNRKMPVRHMGDGHITADPEAYELPGVPWVSTFVSTGVAFHGTYWHNNFGRPMSHGCVNMSYEDAKWLYRWSAPYNPPGEWMTGKRGTVVKIE